MCNPISLPFYINIKGVIISLSWWVND